MVWISVKFAAPLNSMKSNLHIEISLFLKPLEKLNIVSDLDNCNKLCGFHLNACHLPSRLHLSSF